MLKVFEKEIGGREKPGSLRHRHDVFYCTEYIVIIAREKLLQERDLIMIVGTEHWEK